MGSHCHSLRNVAYQGRTDNRPYDDYRVKHGVLGGRRRNFPHNTPVNRSIGKLAGARTVRSPKFIELLHRGRIFDCRTAGETLTGLSLILERNVHFNRI